MQHLEGSGTPVLYIGRKVLKGKSQSTQCRICCLKKVPLGQIFLLVLWSLPTNYHSVTAPATRRHFLTQSRK